MKAKARINRKELISKKASLSYLQILILIISSFAFAYLIYSATEVKAEEDYGNDYDELRSRIYSGLVGNYSQTLEISVLNITSSLAGYVCCEKTTSGQFCQFVQENNCNPNFRKAPTECKYTNYCKLGCCYSISTGWCNENTPQRSCQENSGVWKEDAACNIQECQRGCCVLGRNALFTTQRNCQVEAGFLGIETDFRSEIKTELECIFLAEKDDEGACVYESDFEKTCKFTTRESCSKMNGNFYKNIYCSDSGLSVDCKAHDYFRCAKNKIGNDESVYWFDSCGNKEEVKEECSIFAGTVCGIVSGEAKCKSINCDVEINGEKVKKKNGESWCEYEGTIGNGRDVVGSRHVKHICFMGEERIEPCEDYRNQICVQSDTKLSNGKTFSEAACRINNWRSCFEYNMKDETSGKSMSEKCDKNPDCFIKSVNIADKFSFDLCVPNYPPGFDLTTESGGKNAEMVCGMASQKCTVIYVKKLLGWKCEVNCACEKEGFAQQMNELCTSLGDCGAYVNIAGEVTDEGYSVGGALRLSQSYLDSLKKFAINVAGQKVAPGDLSFLGRLGISPEDVTYNPEGGLSTGTGLGMMGVGFALYTASFMADGFALVESIKLAAEFGGMGAGAGAAGALSAFGNVLVAAGAVLSVASVLQIGFGMDFTNALIIAGAVALLVYIIWGWTGVQYLGIIGLIIIIVFMILGIGKTKKKIVEFKCLPWQPPSGGKDCSKCNSNEPLGVPCSKYRCKSLGQACELINEGTGQETCVDNNPNDVSSPRISPLFGIITEGYQYSNIKDNGFEVLDLQENCIPEFTDVLFGIETDKPSQCKIGTSALQTYDEMEEFFGGSNLYLMNHTIILNIPSPSAFANQYNLTQAQIKSLGEINFYVKCKSVNGKVNDASYIIRSCVKPGPDRTAPYITKTSPANGAYIKYDATEQALSLWTNEPANCKFSTNDGKYDDMENLMACYTSLEDYELWGWPCNTTLTNLKENNKFYIKCRDISENNNTMRQSYVYTLTKSASELKIDEISPSGEIIAGVEPVTVNLESKTSGGAENGKAICDFSFDGNSYITFFETYSDYHKQVFSQMTRGNYKIYVKCEDVAGNTAENFTEFNIYVDTEAPKITRAYYDGELKIMTNENSVCGYSLENCKFEIENATLMSGEEKEHSAEWQTDESYYIKCEDDYGNQPGGCSIIIRAYDII